MLQAIFGDRLVFPADFVGRGDMSRGGLMLRCVSSGAELDYIPVAGAVRNGKRPPKLEPLALPAVEPATTRASNSRFFANFAAHRALRGTASFPRLMFLTSIAEPVSVLHPYSRRRKYVV